MFARSGKRQREECTRRINHPPLIPPLAGLLRLLVYEPMCVKSWRPRGRAPPCESWQTFGDVSAPTARNASVKSAVDVLCTPALFGEASRVIVYRAEHRTCRGLAPSEAHFLEQIVQAADGRPV